MIESLATGFLVAWAGILLYAYLGYPAILKVLTTLGESYELPDEGDPEEWPLVSVSLPAYNEEAVIGDTIESLLALEYPGEKMQIVVISDASTDGTDAIVRDYRDRGVELVRLAERKGKTAAENAAVPYLRGEFIVSTDASTRIVPGSLKSLVRAFRDPSVGVASGRDLSVGPDDTDHLQGESRYVGYEMMIRELETRFGGIVGASGCFYAARRELHRELVPEELSRDFMAALHAHEAGYRAVSISDAVARVPRAMTLQAEYRRKVRTMARGLDSLYYKREILNPLTHGRFAWMVVSHKLARWLVPLLLPGVLVSLLVLALLGHGLAVAACALVVAAAALAVAAVSWPRDRPMPRLLAMIGYLAVGLAAGTVAWVKAVARERQPVWEPTARESLVEKG